MPCCPVGSSRDGILPAARLACGGGPNDLSSAWWPDRQGTGYAYLVLDIRGCESYSSRVRLQPRGVMVNLEALLLETKESPPCGLNLEHDLSFFELEEAARSKPEVRVGDAVKPAEDPKWPKVIELGQGLLLRTKDLRVAV